MTESRPLLAMISISGGALIGQLAVVLAVPIIARLYMPAELGQYAIFAGLVGLVATVVSLHYELAIPLVKGQAGAKRVAVVAIAAIVCVVLGLVILQGAGVMRMVVAPVDDSVGHLIWLAPVCLALQGLYNIATFWAIRHRAYSATAVANALHGLGQSVPPLLAGLAGAGVGGLVSGQLLAPAAGLIALLRSADLHRLFQGAWPGWRRLIATARRYRRFPLFTTWSSLLNALGAHLPVFVLASFFGVAVTGQFALSYRVLQVPLRLVGQSISQVFLGSISGGTEARALSGLTWHVFRLLVACGMPTFAAFGVLAPDLFSIVFGPEWKQAAYFSQLLAPWLFLTFVSTVLSVLVTIQQKQRQELGFQLAYVLCSLVGLGGGLLADSSAVAIGLLGILGSCVLAAKMVWLLRLVGISPRKGIVVLLTESAYSVPVIIAPLAFASLYHSRLLFIVFVGVILLAIHYWNHRFRDVYQLGDATL